MSEPMDDVVAACKALEARLKAALDEARATELGTAVERSVQISSLVRIAWDIARLSEVSIDGFLGTVGKQVRGPDPEIEGPACGDGQCLDCRIRRACGFFETVPVDIQPPIYALGNVLAELLVARKKWQKEPRVAAQMPPAGSA